MTILTGEAEAVLKTLPTESVDCCITSPPYWGLRDYGVAGQLGLETDPRDYVARLTRIMGEVHRVLKKKGTLWLNLGDTYNARPSWGRGHTKRVGGGAPRYAPNSKQASNGAGDIAAPQRMMGGPGIKAKDTVGIPWMAAFSLRRFGWYLRQDIIWSKPNPMPESVKDRCTKAHEYIFLLSKSEKYYFDSKVIAEELEQSSLDRYEHAVKTNEKFDPDRHKNTVGVQSPMEILTKAAKGVLERGTRNKRSVWTVPTAPFSEWVKSTHWERVSSDAASDGSLHIASVDCPVYGGLFDLVATALCDGRGEGDWPRICSICDRLSLTPKAGFVPIETLHAWRLKGRSLDYLVRECCGSASENNTGSHKTDLFVATSLSCTPSDQRRNRIRHTLAGSWLSGQHLDMLLSNTWVDGFDDNQKPETLCCTVDKHNRQEFFSALGPTYKKVTRSTSHFATFPPDLIRPAVRAGCPVGGVVLDPFLGSGTTGLVATEEGRRCIGIELNPEYVKIALERTNITPALAL